MKKFALGGAVLSLAMAAPAHATTYDFDVFTAGFTGALGTVTVTGENTSSTLNFDIALAPNVYFQLPQSGAAHDVFWFDLNKALAGGGVGSFTGDISSVITAPNNPGGPSGGDYTGGQFSIVKSLDSLGQGFIQKYDYGALDDPSVGGVYYTGHLTFSLTALDGSILSLAGRDINGQTVYGGADLRQCPVTGGTCTTGPVGYTGMTPTQLSTTPEPATWAMMLIGFGFVGAAMRRRSQHQAVRLTYA
jgi:hypothetical protein